MTRYLLVLLAYVAFSAHASLNGSYSTPTDAGYERHFTVDVINGKLTLEKDGKLFLAKKMNSDEKSDFARYLLWEENTLDHATCLVTPTASLTSLEELAATAGEDVAAVTANGETALRFIDEQNDKAIIRLTPKYKLRQVLCQSDSDISPVKSSAFFFSRLFGVFPLVKNQ